MSKPVAHRVLDAQESLFASIGTCSRRLVYDGLPPARDTDTSRAAARTQIKRAPSLRVRLLQIIRINGDEGLTSEEAGNAYASERGLPEGHASSRLAAAARLTELKKGGFIVDSGKRRNTSTGCAAAVWVATGKQGDGSICEEQ